MAGTGEGDGTFARPLDGPKAIALSGDVLFEPAVVDSIGAGRGTRTPASAGNDRPAGCTAVQGLTPTAPSAVQGPIASTARAGSNAPDPGRCVSFFVAGQPETQGSLRTMRGRIIDANDKALARWRGFVWTTARAAWDFRPPILDRAVEVDLTFYVISDRRRSPLWWDPDAKLYRLATVGRKDVDKLVRAVFDGITESKLWKDDGLVFEVRARKFFASPPDTPPGVLVKLRVL